MACELREIGLFTGCYLHRSGNNGGIMFHGYVFPKWLGFVLCAIVFVVIGVACFGAACAISLFVGVTLFSLKFYLLFGTLFILLVVACIYKIFS